MSEASALARTPNVIPYVEAHTGPRTTLTLHLKSSMGLGKRAPIASIDGRQYLVLWGTVTFEIPGDRNVHLSVHVETDAVLYAASTVLPPDPEPVTMAYAAGWSGGATLSRVAP